MKLSLFDKSLLRSKSVHRVRNIEAGLTSHSNSVIFINDIPRR